MSEQSVSKYPNDLTLIRIRTFFVTVQVCSRMNCDSVSMKYLRALFKFFSQENLLINRYFTKYLTLSLCIILCHRHFVSEEHKKCAVFMHISKICFRVVLPGSSYFAEENSTNCN